MGFFSEFKAFAAKGNVVDLAVGVIIGAAFGKIVSSLVDDLVLPVIGAIFGQIDFSHWFWVLGRVPEGVVQTLPKLKEAGVPVLAWGNFLSILINFLILAVVIFVMVKQLNRLKLAELPATEVTPPPPPPPPPPPSATTSDFIASEEALAILRDIRDQLKQK